MPALACPSCRYDLSGLAADTMTCPECAAVCTRAEAQLASKDPPDPPRVREQRFLLWATTLGVCAPFALLAISVGAAAFGVIVWAPSILVGTGVCLIAARDQADGQGRAWIGAGALNAFIWFGLVHVALITVTIVISAVVLLI